MIAAALLPGCFYMDPINERPSADILQVNPELPFRGDEITVEPQVVDPDGDPYDVEWRAYACTDARCDTSPYTSGLQTFFQFSAPTKLDNGSPATRLHLQLSVTDSWGAEAMPVQRLDLPLADHEPEVDTPQTSGYPFEGEYPVGTPVRINISATDEDDEGALVFLDPPELYAPDGSLPEEGELVRIDDDDFDGQASWQLLTTKAGQWDMRVTVEDPLEVSDDSGVFSIYVAPDKEPCIGVTDPAFPPPGATIVVDERRRFSVETVLDDRDFFPPPVGDHAFFGAASFRWFLDGQPLGVDGNAVEIDPAQYVPGTQLELRVEVVDRIDAPLCDAAMDACLDRDACYQRQTWTLEVR
jgi:hypothetical protein